jgi:uncharacterized protein with FMN-binding domain
MPKRPIIATFLTAVALVLLLSFKTPTATGASSTAQPQGTQGAAVSGSRSTYSGQVTGSAIDMPFGVVQVRVTFQGGRITDVATLQAPNDNRHSADITSYSTPRLRSEALAAQSAQINTISGATYTSEAYAQSLQSALDQLK